MSYGGKVKGGKRRHRGSSAREKETHREVEEKETLNEVDGGRRKREKIAVIAAGILQNRYIM